ncbi:MAG: CU044_2847 family protein [Pseudonocardiaceae bacterium]
MGDTVVLMAVTELDEGVARPGNVVVQASRSLEEMLKGLRPIAESFVQQFREMTLPPNEVRVQFGVTLSAEAAVIIATTAAQANFSVLLRWSDGTAGAP